MSGAGSLRQSLKGLRSLDTTIRFQDDLAFGPIADVCDEARRQWLTNYYGTDENDGYEHAIWEEQKTFWTDVTKGLRDDLMVWFTRHSSLEYCCFLEFISRLPGSTEFELADFTNETFGVSSASAKTSGVIGTGILNPDQLNRGFEIAKRVRPVEFGAELHLWQRLKSENAPVRAFAGRQLMSASVDHFDPLILHFIGADWARAARVVGNCLGSSFDSGTAEFGDLWIVRRMEAMIEAGLIESDNDGDIIRSTIRLKWGSSP